MGSTGISNSGKAASMKTLASALYRLALALWTGGAALFTFVLTPAIFASFDRDRAGEVVGALFPGYFRWGLITGAVALVCLLLKDRPAPKLKVSVLLAMLALVSVQAFYVEPRAAELKKRIPSFVTTPADDPERAEFRKLHGISMGMNLGVLAGGAVLILLP